MATKQSAYDLARKQLDEWGLGSLANKVIELIQQGLSDEERLLKLRETQEYKTRFHGNEILRQRAKAGEAGIRVLTEAEYLAKEAQLREQLSDPEWGLPRQFYDTPDDYARIIGTGMGAGELQGRLQAVKQVVTSGQLTGALDFARSAYGLTTGDLMAYYLDPDRAAPVLTRQARASTIGAAAKRTGYGTIDAAYAERLDALGLTADQAAAGFTQAAALEGLTTGDEVTAARSDIRDAIFEENNAARERVQRVQEARKARFAGGGNFAESREGIAGLRTAGT